MYDVNAGERLYLRQVEAQSLKGILELSFGAVRNFCPRFGAADTQISVVRMLRAPAMDFHSDFLGQFAAQVVHVDPCAAVNVRRIFSWEYADSHGSTSCGERRSTPAFFPANTRPFGRKISGVHRRFY